MSQVCVSKPAAVVCQPYLLDVQAQSKLPNLEAEQQRMQMLGFCHWCLCCSGGVPMTVHAAASCLALKQKAGQAEAL